MNDRQAIELMRSVESGLRAGFSLRQALERTAQDIDDPGLGTAAASARAGVPLLDIVAAWRQAESNPTVRFLLGAVTVQVRDGGNLADKLGFLVRLAEASSEPEGMLGSS
jgi:Flp pilus assembly protein TadB